MHQPARLFNAVDLQLPGDAIAICEGELDSIIASQILPSVGVPGAKAWRPHFNRLFGGYKRVLVLADNDDKKDGSNPGMELAEKVLQEVEHAELISLPPGSDVNSVVLDEGLEGLRKRLGINE
jgi:DNA primase